MNKNLQLYKKFYTDKQSENLELFQLLRDRYYLNSAIYPGSFVHITPSLVFPKTAYIDSDKRVRAFYADSEVIDWVNQNRNYDEDPDVEGFQQDYSKPLLRDIGQFDLLISQYAGFVSRDCKKYLKAGGILLVNNSHADAGLAYLDPDYEFISVVNHTGGGWVIDEGDLESYFVPSSGDHPTESELLSTMKGAKYKKTASNYIFRKSI